MKRLPRGFVFPPHDQACRNKTPHFPGPYLLVLALLLVTGSAAEIRNWTSKDGRTLHAELVGLYPTGAKLRLANGTLVQVRFSSLSDDDADHDRLTGAGIIPEWNGWPSEVRMNLSDVKVTFDQERSGNGPAFFYLTEHFELKSEVQLGGQVMLEVGRIFELTYRLLELSPWGIMASPEGGRFKAELYKTRQSYIAAGAPEWSGGVYMGERKVFMVPVQSLGLKETPNGYVRDDGYSLDTVVHEMTHMLMGDALSALPIAVAEGLAEYISHIPLRHGAFKPGSVLDMIRKKSETRSPLDFNTLLGMTHKTWAGAGPPQKEPKPVTGGEQVRLMQQYHAATLFAYHAMEQLDGGKPVRLQKLIFHAYAKNMNLNVSLERYRRECKEYEAALEAFAKLPGVEKKPDGTILFPENLVPPTPPPVPVFKEETAEQRERGGLDLLFAGQSKEAFVKNMVDQLSSAKIRLSQKP